MPGEEEAVGAHTLDKQNTNLEKYSEGVFSNREFLISCAIEQKLHITNIGFDKLDCTTNVY